MKKKEKEIRDPEKLKALGNQQIDRCNYEKAIEYYNMAIAISQSAVFYSNRSLAQFYLFKYDLALADAKQAISLDSSFAKGYYRAFKALLQLNQIQQAERMLNYSKQASLQPQLLAEMQSLIISEKNAHGQELAQQAVELVEWLSKGNHFPKLKIKQYQPGNRGVLATQRIERDQVILQVKLPFLITLQVAKTTTVAEKLIAAKVELISPKHSCFCIYLLQQLKNETSIWSPYLNILPKKLNFPIFFTEEQMKLLEGSFLKQLILEKRQDILKDYSVICQAAPQFSQFSVEQFTWGRFIAASRIFGLTIDSVKTDALVPFADMLNHRLPKQTAWRYSEQRKSFVITALEAIPRGSQVYDSYGKKCNSRFFLNYGFILPNNDANEVPVKIKFNLADPLIKLKRSILRQSSDHRVFKLTKNCQQGQFTQLAQTAKILLLSDFDTLRKLASEADAEPVFWGNKAEQIQFWNYFQSVLSNKLNQFTSNVEEDRLLLGRKQLTQNQRNCIRFRLDQKLILEGYRSMCEKMLRLLQKSGKDLEKAAMTKQFHDYGSYIKKVVLSRQW